MEAETVPRPAKDQLAGVVRVLLPTGQSAEQRHDRCCVVLVWRSCSHLGQTPFFLHFAYPFGLGNIGRHPLGLG